MINTSNFKSADPYKLPVNFFNAIGNEWMLISVRNDDRFNMMTASWGGTGIMWNIPVFTCCIRPQRYTFEFAENTDIITLNFFGKQYREALNFCGSKSGRDYDKAAETGLTPNLSIDKAVYFDEASMVIVGRKLYADFLKKDKFTDAAIPPSKYADDDFHKMYVCQIEQLLIKE